MNRVTLAVLATFVLILLISGLLLTFFAIAPEPL